MKYIKSSGELRTEIFKMRITKSEKEYLSLLSEKENKTITKYVCDKLGLNNIDYDSIAKITNKKKSHKTNINILWGLIKITR